jgi:hypothetical protein
LLFVTIDAIVQFFRDEMKNNWLAIVIMLLMIILDIFAHRANIARIIEDKENPADLGDAFKKDIDRIKSKKQKEETSSNIDKSHKKSVKNSEEVEKTTPNNK